MTSTKHESRGESVGSFPSTPRTPPRSTGFRTKLHTISSSARGLLCIYPPNDAYENHWPSNDKVARHTPARSKSQPSSRDTTTSPWNVVRGRSCQVHTKKVPKQEARDTIWNDKMTTATATMTMTATPATTKFSQPGSKPSSEGAVSVNAPLIEESGAQRPGSESPQSPRYDDHVAPPLHFNGTQSRAKEAEQQHIATGDPDTIEALIDAILQIGDSAEEECYSVANLVGTSLLGTEAAIDDKSMIFGAEVQERVVAEEKTTKHCSAADGAWEEGGADARRAWEDMKRRVMDIEEFGALPLGGAGAGDAEPERASREFRARRRRSWAEKTVGLGGHAPREEAKSRRTATNPKKRRRHAGCWVRKDGVFMRLVRSREHPFFLSSLAHSLFFHSTHAECEAYQALAFGIGPLGGTLFRSERTGRPMNCGLPREEPSPGEGREMYGQQVPSVPGIHFSRMPPRSVLSS
jgi:hypothetical protein